MTAMRRRFGGLQAALAKAAAAARASDNDRNARVRPTARVETYAGRLGSNNGPGGAPAPAVIAKPTVKARSTQHNKSSAAASAEDAAWPVPAEIAAQGAVKAEGYRITFTAVTDQLRRMSMIPAARGRAGSLIRMVAAGASDNEIRSNLELKPTDSQIATSTIWDRAIVAVCGSIVKDGSGSKLPAPRDAARQRMLAVAAHPYFAGNEAKALTHLTSRALMPVGAQGIVKLVAMTNGERRSVEAWGGDIHPAWAKAIESTFR